MKDTIHPRTTSRCTRSLVAVLALVTLASPPGFVSAEDQSKPLLKTEHFDSDPGWDNSSNRMEASDPPTVKQDFGWSAGKIGGAVWRCWRFADYDSTVKPQ